MKTMQAAIAAAVLLTSAMPAEAQRFYMREKITGLKSVATPTTPPAPAVTYSWATGSWQSSNTCSSSTTQYRSVVCRGSDGKNYADASCSGAGSKPSSSQNASDFSGCTLTLHDHGYGACTNGQRPHYYDCLRSDGTDGIFVVQCSSYSNNPVMESC